MERKNRTVHRVIMGILIISFAFIFVALLGNAAWAKYCPSCGTYNNDSNSFCTKCGADLRGKTASNKPRVGVLFVASVYPYQDSRFTIYHKGNITPFIVWNSEGKYEIGEDTLPVLPDVDFVPILEREIPSPSSVPYVAKRYNLEKLMVLNMNAKKVERVPLFSSQGYDVYLDVITYKCPTGELIQEKRYKGNVNGYPDITVNQVKDTCRGIWEQFTPNIYSLLRR
jgi:hypothetical protein